MTSEISVSPAVVHGLLKYAARQGLAMDKIRQAASLPAAWPESPTQRLPVGRFQALWAEIVSRCQDPFFGLHIGQATRETFSGDILTTVLLNCPTMGVAMRKLAQYHALATDFVQIRLEESGLYAYYGWTPALPDAPADRHLSEVVIFQLYTTLKALSEGRMPIVEIHFRHLQPDDLSEFGRLFNCKVRFAQPRDALIIERSGLEIPIALANPQLLAGLEALAGELLQQLYTPDSWPEKARRQIGKTIMAGQEPGLERLAGELAISPRSLQNKLKEAGLTYRSLLAQTRQEIACAYLEKPEAQICDLALLLGFSEQSAFNHAFKRWTGMAPGEYRSSSRKP